MKPLTLKAYGFLLPALLIFALSTFLPVVQAFFLSFTRYDILNLPQWVGLVNYQRLWADSLFWKVLGNTLIYLLGVVPALVILPLGLAILLNRSLPFLAGFRVLYYIPVIIPMVIAGVTWKWVYGERGLLNGLLRASGVVEVAIPWLTSGGSLFAVMLVTVWKGLGYYMVIYLAGLQGIPRPLYEAAALDGADGWRKHWFITVPLMRPYILLVAVLSSISAMKVFEEIYVMTRGGPVNNSKTIVYYLYEKAFTNLELGYACAVGIVLFLILLAFSLLNARLSNTVASMQG
ncbi:carbohydrate ABC transporter permease [Anthocerotibacter panamensis]|uniref:carbohydrate ABC transporter permease n=1 Tax=Anthocerotibacter panamensis TaxID=2857077 RepID=UPI001C401F34|nr:sugar ABC transporter permease [Anthocerotibacter panamensis]